MWGYISNILPIGKLLEIYILYSLFYMVKIKWNGGFRLNNASKIRLGWAAQDHLGELSGNVPQYY